MPVAQSPQNVHSKVQIQASPSAASAAWQRSQTGRISSDTRLAPSGHQAKRQIIGRRVLDP